MREPDYEAHPALDRLLLPPETTPAPPGRATVADAEKAWSATLGGRPVLVVPSVAVARAALLRAAGIRQGESVGVPANATNALVEAIRRHGARPCFLDLDGELALVAGVPPKGAARIAWCEPVGGLPGRGHVPSSELWVDHADSLPPCDAPPGAAQTARVTLWGLHLSADPARAGALLAFAEPDDFHAAVASEIAATDRPNPERALAQLHRLNDDGVGAGLAARQRELLSAVHRGLDEAAGLPLLPFDAGDALASHIGLQIPEETQPTTFYAYVRGENTPVRWLPEVRPLHHAALRVGGSAAAARTAANLARWLLVPVGPEYTDTEIEHAVLGVVKASEHLGVRWRTDPGRAAEYAAMLDSTYGPDHDAYRPVFDTGGRFNSEHAPRSCL